MLVLIIIGLNALVVRKFDYSRLLYGQDFRTDYCGQKQLSNETLVYWPEPVAWGPYVKTCVPKCPTSE